MGAKRGRCSWNEWTSVRRRVFLKGTAAAAGVAALDRFATMVAAGQAPAYPRGTKLHMLSWQNFVVEADTVLLSQA